MCLRRFVREEGSQPRRNRPLEGDYLTVFASGYESKRSPEIAVIEDPDMRKFTDSSLEIAQDARIAGNQLLFGNIVSSLRNAHGNALLGDLRPWRSDKAQKNVVAGARSLLEERQLVSHGIGKYCFKNKTLAQVDQLAPN